MIQTPSGDHWGYQSVSSLSPPLEVNCTRAFTLPLVGIFQISIGPALTVLREKAIHWPSGETVAVTTPSGGSPPLFQWSTSLVSPVPPNSSMLTRNAPVSLRVYTRLALRRAVTANGSRAVGAQNVSGAFPLP